MRSKRLYEFIKKQVPRKVRKIVEGDLEKLVPTMEMSPNQINMAKSRVCHRIATTTILLGSYKRKPLRYYITAIIDAALDLGEDSPIGREIFNLGLDLYHSMSKNKQRECSYIEEDAQLNPFLFLEEEPTSDQRERYIVS